MKRLHKVFLTPGFSVFCIIVFSLLIKLPDLLNGVNWAYGGDEATYIQLAAKVAMGDFVFPQESPFVIGQATRYSFIFPLAFLYKLFGVCTFSWALLQVLIVVLYSLSVYFIGNNLFSKEVGLWMLLGISVLPIVNFMAVRYYPDIFSFAYFMASLAFCTKKPPQRNKWDYLFGSFFYVLSVLTNIKQFLLFPIIIICILFTNGGLKINRFVSVGKFSAIFLLMLLCFKSFEYHHTRTFFNQRQLAIVGKNNAHSSEESNLLITLYNKYDERFKKRAKNGLMHPFGIAKQMINGAQYYDNYAPYSLVLLGLFILLLTYSILNNEFDLSSRKNMILLLGIIFLLYILYEFVGYIGYRKLYRYFLELPSLISMATFASVALFFRKYAVFPILACLFLALVIIDDFFGYFTSLFLVCLFFALFRALFFRKGLANAVAILAVFLPVSYIVSLQSETSSPNYIWAENQISKIDSVVKDRGVYTNSVFLKQGLNYVQDYRNIDELNNFHELSSLSDPHIRYLNEGHIGNLPHNSLIVIDRKAKKGKRRWQLSNMRIEPNSLRTANMIYKTPRFNLYKIDSCSLISEESLSYAVKYLVDRGLEYHVDLKQIIDTHEVNIIYEFSFDIDAYDSQFVIVDFRGPQNSSIEHREHNFKNKTNRVQLMVPEGTVSIRILPNNYIWPSRGTSVITFDAEHKITNLSLSKFEKCF